MKIFIASDHKGITVKKIICNFLENQNINYEDFSPENKIFDDYPDYANKVSEAINKTKNIGILICGTGIGMSITANKHKNIRAALCHTVTDAKYSRAHNDANILVLSSKISSNNIKKIVKTFLNTKFEKGRHLRRINKIKKIEKTTFKN